MAEIATAGCFGIYATPGVPGRFSSLCGDGTALTVDFDAHGKEIGRKRSAVLFDPDKDALFITGVRVGDRTLDELRRRGHDVGVAHPWSLGRMCAVSRTPDGARSRRRAKSTAFIAFAMEFSRIFFGIR